MYLYIYLFSVDDFFLSYREVLVIRCAGFAIHFTDFSFIYYYYHHLQCNGSSNTKVMDLIPRKCINGSNVQPTWNAMQCCYRSVKLRQKLILKIVFINSLAHKITNQLKKINIKIKVIQNINKYYYTIYIILK